MGVFPQGLPVLPHIFLLYQRQNRIAEPLRVGAGRFGDLRETFRSHNTGTVGSRTRKELTLIVCSV